MTDQQRRDALVLAARFPHMSRSARAINFPPHHDHHPHHTGPPAELERDPLARPLAAQQTKAQSPSRVHLRFESVRTRLLDPDNISAKWTLDALRYAGIIRGDEPDKITIEVCQRKAQKGEAEHTVVTMTFPE